MQNYFVKFLLGYLLRFSKNFLQILKLYYLLIFLYNLTIFFSSQIIHFRPSCSKNIYIYIQLISYKRYLKVTLVQRRLSIYPQCTQVAEGTFFMKSPVCYKFFYVLPNTNTVNFKIIFIMPHKINIMKIVKYIKKDVGQVRCCQTFFLKVQSK